MSRNVGVFIDSRRNGIKRGWRTFLRCCLPDSDELEIGRRIKWKAGIFIIDTTHPAAP